MASQSSANAVRAGLFVIISIAIAVAVIVALSGVLAKLEPTNPYTVRFELANGAAGLETDSPVRVGGRDVGRVSRIMFERDDSGELSGVLVQIAIDDDLVVHEGATAYLERPLLGSGAALNFESLGDHTRGDIPPGGMIPGATQVPQFMAQAGYGATQREQLQSTLARAHDFTEEFTAELDAIIKDVRAMTADARERSGGWFDRTDEIIEEIRSASAEIRQGVEEGRALVASLQDGVDDNRENIDRVIANIESASARADELMLRVNEETIAMVEALLQDGRDGVADARAAINRVDGLVAEQTPAVRKSLANARLASDQLRLTMGEVRRAPWRLLHRPAERELEFELLYDAARAYASAVSDLRDASESLDRLSAESQDITPYAQSLSEAFERYQSAEERFLTLLTSNAP